MFSWETTRGIDPENCAESIPHGLNAPSICLDDDSFPGNAGVLVQLPVITPESGCSEVVLQATSLLRDCSSRIVSAYLFLYIHNAL